MRLSFIFVNLFFFCGLLSGQWLGGGVKGGFGQNAADGWSRGTTTELFRPTVGVFLEVRLPFGLAVEGGALRREAAYVYTDGRPGLAFREGQTDGRAWEYPVLGKVRLGPWRWKPFVLAGPTWLKMGRLTGSQSCVGPACGVGLGPVPVEIPGRTDQGFTMGGGVERRWGPVRLSAEGRHSQFVTRTGVARSGQTLVLFGLGF
jgi:hypothetical protein